MKHTYDRDTFLLCEPASVQNYLLDRYRLTDAFKAEYIRHMLSTPENEGTVRQALAAIDKYTGTAGASIATHDGMAGDILYARYVLGFRYWEYFAYGLGPLSTSARLGFLPEMGRMAYTAVLNPSQAENSKLSQKPVLAGVVKEDFGRDSAVAKKDGDFDGFRVFALRHPRFFAKPCWGSLGEGAHVVDTAGFSNRRLRLVFNRLKGVKHGSFCEELIVSDGRMAAFHPASVNTVRVVTYLGIDGEARIVCAYLRAGRGGSIVDNAASGGVLAAVDPSTGIVSADASGEAGDRYACHPDTGLPFKGFQVPEWSALVDVASRCAKRLPCVRLIGWDMALSERRGWIVVEANCQAQFNAVQASTRRGIRDRFERDIEWDLNRKAAKAEKA